MSDTMDFKIGDEVYTNYGNHEKMVITAFVEWEKGDNRAASMTASGVWSVDRLTALHKTGRHFPQIAEIQKQMAEKGE